MAQNHRLLVGLLVIVAVAATAKEISISQGGRAVSCSLSSGTTALELKCRLAEFGDAVDANAPVVIPDGDEFGCSLPAHSADGEIVVVKRGVCPFTDKASAAAQAGAAGLVVVNINDDLPTLGGRPDREIPFPVVLVSHTDGTALLLAATTASTSLSITVAAKQVIQPVRSLQQSLLLRPRQCSGRERLVIVAVADELDRGASLVNSAGGRAISVNLLQLDGRPTLATMAVAAHDFINSNTVSSDVVVVLLGFEGGIHAVAAGAEAIAARFCAQHGAAVFAASSSCRHCGTAEREHFATQHGGGLSRPYPNPAAFVAYADASLSLLQDLSDDTTSLLATVKSQSFTRVDVLANLFFDVEGLALEDALGIVRDGQQAVNSDGDTQIPTADQQPLFIQAPGRVSTRTAGTSPVLLLNIAVPPSADEGRWVAMLVRGRPLRAEDVHTGAGNPSVLTMLSPSVASQFLGNKTSPQPPRFIPVGSAGPKVWCQACFAQYSSITREEQSSVQPLDTSTYPFATNRAFRDWCTWIVDGTDTEHTPAAVHENLKTGDTVFVSNDQLSNFFVHYSAGIKEPYVMVTDAQTHHPDSAATQAVPGVWRGVVGSDPNILAWWAMGPTGRQRFAKVRKTSHFLERFCFVLLFWPRNLV